MPHINEADATALSDQADQRMLWTGAAANGALILAYVGFAGNADNPVQALRFLSWPLVLAITGFSVGTVAITHGLVRVACRTLEAAAIARLQFAQSSMAAFADVFSGPSIDPSVATLIWGDNADDELRKLLLGRLSAAKIATDKAPGIADEALDLQEKAADEGRTAVQRGRRWLVGSFLIAALSVATLLAAAWLADPAILGLARLS